jgi:rSAM/selenodomain-associated transferase 1
MKAENLLIVFVKNAIRGKVKTRLAQSIGDEEALNVYRHLVRITERESLKLSHCDVHIYFTENEQSTFWPNNKKFVQFGDDLGKRMMNAFQNGFNSGYKKIIAIGSDLPDLKVEIMSEGLKALDFNDTVFGPAEDGGYYLVGMKRIIPEIFINKRWSDPSLLVATTDELKRIGYSFELLFPLNDVDTVEDLKKSSIALKFKHLLGS